MSRLALLLLPILVLSGPVHADEIVGEEEIIVLAKVNSVKMTLGRDAAGKVVCNLDKSSGDAKIDGLMCREGAKCIGKKPTPPAKVEACIDKRKKALVKRLVRERAS